MFFFAHLHIFNSSLDCCCNINFSHTLSHSLTLSISLYMCHIFRPRPHLHPFSSSEEDDEDDEDEEDFEETDECALGTDAFFVASISL